MLVYRYGRPGFKQVSNGTVLTTVTTSSNDAFSANINMNGIGVNFSISDPSIRTTTTAIITTIFQMSTNSR